MRILVSIFSGVIFITLIIIIIQVIFKCTENPGGGGGGYSTYVWVGGAAQTLKH